MEQSSSSTARRASALSPVTERDDVFVHFSNIVGENYRTLEAGQEVEFDIGPGRKGDEAQNVKPV